MDKMVYANPRLKTKSMISILPYSEKYKQDVIDLILNIWENEFDYKNLKRPDIHNITEFYQKDQKSNFWIALLDDKLIGTIALKKGGNDSGYLKRMAIIKNMRRKGIGAKLLNTLMKFAKKNGYKKIYAGLVPENTIAISFYKKNGFVESKFVPKNITAASDSICLRLDLQD